MKKIIVTIFSILLICISLVFIIKLLNPEFLKNMNNNSTTTHVTNSEVGYSLINTGNYFDSYQIDYNLEHDFNFYIQNVDILYSNRDIYVANELIVENVSLYKYFALYDKSLIVLLYTNINDDKSAIIIYDIYEKTFSLIDKYDDMFTILENDIYFNDTGFIFDVSIVFGDKININNKLIDICNINDSSLIVKKGIEINYNSNARAFNAFEELYSTTLDSYVTINKLCK